MRKVSVWRCSPHHLERKAVGARQCPGSWIAPSGVPRRVEIPSEEDILPTADDASGSGVNYREGPARRATSVRVPAQSSLVMSSRWVEAGLELRQKDSGSHTQAVGVSSGHVSFNIY